MGYDKFDVDEMITNIFWADHQMITDYGIFECRPLALFTGFNHFRMAVIFGAALLYDETTASFEWVI
ncbi:hypothetical protein ACSBR1_015325 [Camellia fascicularis]